MSPFARAAIFVLFALLIAGCDGSKLSDAETEGPNPVIPAPRAALVPDLNLARAVGWPKGGAPQPAAGLAVNAFAAGLDHPRWLHVLPNSDVLVAETNAPKGEGTGLGGVKAAVMTMAMNYAGAGVPSPNRIILLRDADGDGVAETREVFLEGLNSPFGMALIGDKLYVANTDALLRFDYPEGATRITTQATKIADLPSSPINYHWTKSLVPSPDGSRLYVGVGSNSNFGENGRAVEEGRARILKIDPATGESHAFATGLRNPVGLAFAPGGSALWAVVNERDELGSDLVPDYLTEAKEGAFYGWPFSYWGQHVDTRVVPQDPDLVAKALKPDYSLGNHVAPIGLAFGGGEAWPQALQNGAFVGEHGSWNRIPFGGYKVVFVPFQGGKPVGLPVDVLTGFLNGIGEAQGRPAGLAFDHKGALLVADDVGNTVWRLTPRAPKP